MTNDLDDRLQRYAMTLDRAIDERLGDEATYPPPADGTPVRWRLIAAAAAVTAVAALGLVMVRSPGGTTVQPGDASGQTTTAGEPVATTTVAEQVVTTVVESVTFVCRPGAAMPDLVGMVLSPAAPTFPALDHEGCGELTWTFVTTAEPEGTVVAQEPAPGEPLDAGTAIMISIDDDGTYAAMTVPAAPGG
jgi:hypothetical protein